MDDQIQSANEKIDACWNHIGVWSRKDDKCPELKAFIHCRNCPVYTSIGRKLLEYPVTQEYIQECTEALATDFQEKDTFTESAFVFRTGSEWMALPSNLIQEVIDMGVIHSIPHRSNNILRGAVNIRGKLELCLSFGAVLGIEREPKKSSQQPQYSTPERLVVAVRNGQKIVFPVTEVIGNVRYSSEMIRTLPVTVSGAKAVFTKGILCLNDLDIGLLKDEILFETLIGKLS